MTERPMTQNGSDKEHYAFLTFHGATGEVTGANFLLEIDGK